MIGPSPDWFVGLHGQSLLNSDSEWVSTLTVNLYPYDAGTEDGTEFTLSNAATSPQGVITSLRGVGKFSNAPMATISFTRQDSPPPQTAPTISAIERPSNTTQATNADSVTWLVTFSETVQNVSTDDFVVSGTTASVTSVSLTSGSTTEYRVVVSGGNLANLDATISLGLASQQNITNSSGVALSTTVPSSSETYTIDNTDPRVVSVVPTSTDESPFTATITFNESLDSTSFTDVGDVSSDEAEVLAPSGSGLSYRVSVTPDDPLRPSTITLTIVAGAATDLAGNTSTEHEATIEYTPDINRTPPVVDRVSALIPDGLYHTGEMIVVGVTFSQPVTVTGIPVLMLQFDRGTGTARYVRGSGTNTLIFDYTLIPGDASTDLGYTDSAALSPATGSITGTGGLGAVLTLPVPGSAGSLQQSSDIETSGREDMMPTFGTATINDQVLMMNQHVEAIQLPSAIGGDAPLQHALEPTLPPGLELDEEKQVISGTPTEVFNRATFSWTATDVDGDRVELTFTIMILPQLPLQFPSFASIPDQVFLQNELIETVELPIARGGAGVLTYSLDPALPTGLTVDLNARQITGTPTAVLAETTYTWRVTDSEGTSVTLTFQLTVLEDLQPNFDRVMSTIDEAFIQNSAITPFTLPSAESGNGQVTYVLESPLPSDLVLDVTTFEVSGIPSEPLARTSFNWTATDEDGDSVKFTFYITVLEDVMPSFASDASVAEQVFISDSGIEPFQLPRAMGGNGALIYMVVPDLPNGLELDTATFEISGTPAVPLVRTPFAWSVHDEDGDSATFTFYITVLEDVMPSFSSDASVTEQVFISDSAITPFTLPSAESGNGQLTYSLQSALPNGLVLDEATFEVRGTPLAPLTRTRFNWTATDEDGDSATLTFYITVLEDVMPSFAADTSVTELEFISDSSITPFALPRAESGNGQIKYLLEQTLPSGLVLDEATFEVSGTPLEPLARTGFNWTATDEDGDSATFTFFITVLEDVMPSFTSDASVAEQEFISDSMIEPFRLPRATSGNGALRYNVAPDLPNGLELDSTTFEISGTPTEPLSRTQFTWSVQDEDGDSATLMFFITVLEDLMPSFASDASVADQDFISDSAIEPFRLPRAMGGNGALRYELAPELPNGLELVSTTFEIGGTPTEVLPRTQFTWSVQDEDGDSSSIQFYLTVNEDTQPTFTDQIADKAFVVGTPIEPLTLPQASGGNSELTYELMPQLPSGLDFDANTRSLEGTPTTETALTNFSWRVTDFDGDVATLTFSVVVHPAQPEIIGNLSNVRLAVGGNPQTIDATSAIRGTVESWQFEVADPSVVAMSSSSSGMTTLMPRIEGRTTVTVTAANVSGMVSISFVVDVETDSIENDQIDVALSLKAGALLSGSMNVFKHRAHSHSSSNDASQAFAPVFDSALRPSEPYSPFQDLRPKQFDHGFASVNRPRISVFESDFVPLNFTHTSSRWSMWGAVDFQNYSNDAAEKEIDGTLSSLYFGADISVNDNIATGIAYARHVGSTAYEFSSEAAMGDAEIETTLNGLYPYLQADNGNRFSMFLVGGIGYGDSQINRNHANGSDQNTDTDLSLFAGGFDYVILRRANVDVAIVGDAGVATLSTQTGSGVLANRQSSSSKSSIGGSVSFKPQVEGGSLVVSADTRLATGADGDESGSGFELGANLSYFGDRFEFMLDGRTSSRSSDANVQRSSISGRLRYRANSDGTGIALSFSPRWNAGGLQPSAGSMDPFNRSNTIIQSSTSAQRSYETEIGYGLWTNDSRALLKPKLAWQRVDSGGSAWKIGTEWRLMHSRKSNPRIGFDLIRNEYPLDQTQVGFNFYFDARM